MKVAGIIAEYNPFHNGHKYHIEETRRITEADYIIVVMSGNFVQRGSPALMDKYSRTRMALNNGADLVLELPVCYATGSAEYFATGAVALLDQLGIVDYLCFGSECGDVALLDETARLLLDTTSDWEAKTYAYMKEGFTYPSARYQALAQTLDSDGTSDHFVKISRVLTEPNNILGLEYIKALIKLSSNITPITIQRQSAHYHDAELTDQKMVTPPIYQYYPSNLPKPDKQIEALISSATAIRNTLQSISSVFDLTAIKMSIPTDVYEYMMKRYYSSYPVVDEDFSQILKYKLLTEDRNSLMGYVDITADLADRMTNHKDLHCSFEELLLSIKSKNLTRSRVNRAIIHILLNIKNDTFQEYCKNGYIFYARVLGFQKSASSLLRKVQDSERIPVITKLAQATHELDSYGSKMLSTDILATHIYNQAVYEKYGTSIPNEYKHGIFIL